jgi:rare lipoprotein A
MKKIVTLTVLSFLFPVVSYVSAQEFRQYGNASWYGNSFHGRPTASGESYDMHEFTGAHRDLPFGTVIKVKNLRNGREVVVRVNDRGPFIKSRIVDLSRAAASMLGIVSRGTARVSIEVISFPDGSPPLSPL